MNLQQIADENSKVLEGARRAYKEHQRNVKISEANRCEILKGAIDGRDIGELFTLAIETISAMTGDQVFARQVLELTEQHKKRTGDRA